ncbi:glucose 1-dehydrogenase [Marinibaculum pumilum]|uniref:Glucose 1-dehydrogenase n=1 Tax=Marinibaculum pumilum TaxID=1766165 RepID=A0ABV7L2Y5_9PROT
MDDPKPGPATAGDRAALPAAFRLDGQVALVTGSSQGIGAATARVLAQAGAHVVISSRKAEACESVVAALRDEGLKAEARACHVGRLADIEAMEAHLQAAHGGLDILVNNAVLSPWRSIADTDPGLFAKTVEVNLQGHWFLSTAAVRLMKPRGGGSIVNISSVAAMHPQTMLALYGTLKSALTGMSRSFALEHGPDGIRANTVLPGLIQTSLADAFDAETQARIEGRTPLGRLGLPEEIGNAVLYLSSPAGAFVTGASLVVDGGLSLSLF